MPEIHGKKVFRIQLSISIVLLLLSLSALSLVTSFYLGMIAGKSMQRPPEIFEQEDSLAEQPMSEEDLKFFSLGEKKKDEELLDLEDLNNLKKKTEELTKSPEKPRLVKPEKPRTNIPKVSKPKISNSDKKVIGKENQPKLKSQLLKRSSKSKEIKPKIAKTKTYTIQVFASRNQQNAKILLEKLKKSGFKDAFIFKHSAGNKTLYRVRVGKLLRSETKKFVNDLKKLKFIDSVQVTRF